MRLIGLQRERRAIEVDDLLMVQAMKKGWIASARISDGDILKGISSSYLIEHLPLRCPFPHHSTIDLHPREVSIRHLLLPVSDSPQTK